MKPIYVYIQTDLRLVVFKNLHCQVLFKARSYPVLGAVVLPRLHPSHPWAPHMCVRPRRIIATPLASPLFMLIRLWRPAIVAAVCTCRRPSRRRSPISLWIPPCPVAAAGAPSHPYRPERVPHPSRQLPPSSPTLSRPIVALAAPFSTALAWAWPSAALARQRNRSKFPFFFVQKTNFAYFKAIQAKA